MKGSCDSNLSDEEFMAEVKRSTKEEKVEMSGEEEVDFFQGI